MEWLPLKIYGTVRNRPRVKKWILRIKGTVYEYNYDESNKDEIYNNVLNIQKQKTLELYQGQINIYKIQDTFVMVQTNMGLIKIDLEDLPKIQGYYWSHKEGRKHITSSINGVRTSLQVHLYGVPIQQPDHLDFRRSKIKLSLDVNINLNFNRYLFEDGPYIPKNVWKTITNNDNFEYLVKELSISLINKYPEPPIPIITNADLYDNLLLLESDSLTDFKANRHGTLLAKRFINHLILETKIEPYPTLYEVWKDPSKLTYIIQKYHYFAKESNNFNAQYIVRMHNIIYQQGSNFPPNIAKQLYDSYKPKVVLDLCAGFGGRFIGFWFSEAQTYIGVDPNLKLQEPHNQMITYLKNHFPNKNKNIHILYKTAEGLNYLKILKDYSLDSIDLIFTSPPYFNKEIYSDDINQSSSRYTTLESWYQDFLLKILQLSSSILKQNGILCINFKDPKDQNISLRFIEDLKPIYNYLGQRFISFASRPGQNSNQEAIHFFYKL